MGRPDRAAGSRPCEPFGFDVCSVSATIFQSKPGAKLAKLSGAPCAIRIRAKPACYGLPGGRRNGLVRIEDRILYSATFHSTLGRGLAGL